MAPTQTRTELARSPAADNTLASPTRLDALQGTGLMHSPEEVAFDRLTRLASRFLRAPVALVSLVDDRRQFFKSAVGLPKPWAQRRETPLSHSFCQHVVTKAKPLIIEDARHHPLVRDNLAVRDLKVVAYAGIPLRLSSGLVLGSFCVIDGVPRQWSDMDIASLEDLAASVTTEIELRLMLAAQGDVMGIVSHDLKNPLSSIGMNCQRIANEIQAHPEALSPKMERAVARIQRAHDRMHEMVMHLLDQARHNHGRIVLRMQVNSAQSLALKAIESVQTLAEAKQVELVMGKGIGDVQMKCDLPRMSQVLTNLLSNAITYTSELSQVAIDAAEENGKVRISVRDQGPGIAKDDQVKLFERFWRAPDAAEGGHGMGLHGATKLAEAQGARLGVESEVGAGATFYIELPSSKMDPAPC